MKSSQKQLGFTLVEIMVALVVLGILISIAMPSFQAMVMNSQIRNAAESVSNGLAKARAEAINRNENVAFTLGAGTSWSITASDDTVIESRASREGSSDVTLTAVDSAAVAATSVTFNSLGSIVGISPVDQIDFTATGANKNLRVVIGGLGGKVKVCDPNLTTGSSPLAC